MTARVTTGTLPAPAVAEGPGTHDRDEALARWLSERARRALVLDSIRAHLSEQPSASCIRSAARAWCGDITQIAETVITARKNPEHDE